MPQAVISFPFGQPSHPPPFILHVHAPRPSHFQQLVCIYAAASPWTFAMAASAQRCCACDAHNPAPWSAHRL